MKMRPKLLKVQSENQWFQRAEVLQRNRKKRKQHRQFLVEGVHSLNGLVANNAWPSKPCSTPPTGGSPIGRVQSSRPRPPAIT